MPRKAKAQPQAEKPAEKPVVCITPAQVYARLKSRPKPKPDTGIFDWGAWYKSLVPAYVIPDPSETELAAQRELDAEHGRKETI